MTARCLAGVSALEGEVISHQEPHGSKEHLKRASRRYIPAGLPPIHETLPCKLPHGRRLKNLTHDKHSDIIQIHLQILQVFHGALDANPIWILARCIFYVPFA